MHAARLLMMLVRPVSRIGRAVDILFSLENLLVLCDCDFALIRMSDTAHRIRAEHIHESANMIFDISESHAYHSQSVNPSIRQSISQSTFTRTEQKAKKREIYDEFRR